MKNILFGTLSLLLLGGMCIASCAGTPPDPSPQSLSAPDMPAGGDDLDRWIAGREASLAPRPGLAKGIVWARPDTKERTPVSIIYLHGYSASRNEMYPAPEEIAQALGANLYCTRLQGHGLVPEGHGTATIEGWMADGVEALDIGKRIGERVVVISCSTGSPLAAWLEMGPRGADVAAHIMVSPNLGIRDKASEQLLMPWGDFLRGVLVGPKRIVPTINQLHGQWWDNVHDSRSLIPMMQLVTLVRKSDFTTWKHPVMVWSNPDDGLVDPGDSLPRFREIPGGLCTLRTVHPEAGQHDHVLAGDALSPAFTATFVAESMAWLQAQGF